MAQNQENQGAAYLAKVSAIEAKCGIMTDDWISRAQGKQFPQAIELLGRTLESIETAACCGWGCENPSHDLEKLAGHLYNLATGALRLTWTGRYDEALSLVRSMGEIGNVLTLFALAPGKRREWAGIDDRNRRSEFSPVKVRITIESKDIAPAMDSEEYADLCEQAAHATPSASPGGYNTHRTPVLGGHLQPEGIIVVMCSLVRITGRCAVVLSQLLMIPPEQRNALLTLGEELNAALGGHTAKSMRQRVRSLT